jgi:sugar O-acyltransferase (sialic acid O-acetyltransferase NeuD family)
MKMQIVILGAKNPEAARVIEALNAHRDLLGPGLGGADDFQFVGFLDNNAANMPPTFCGLPLFGGFEKLDGLIEEGCWFVNTITGTTVSRYETSRTICERGGQLVNFIHPGTDANITMGVGNYIQDHVVLQAAVEIGDNCAINAGGIVSHETKLGHSVFLAPGVRIAGEVMVEDGVFVGIGATIAPRLKIGKWATIGAGAVVTSDVPDYAVVVGNPGRIIRYAERLYVSGDVRAQT